jgi:signal transduction histidine kinase
MLDAPMGHGAHEASRHKCLIYDGDPAEQLPVVLPLLSDGLRDNWRCLYLGSPDAVRMVGSALGTRGVDVDRETSRGSLVLSSGRDHLAGGTFDPTAMIDGLRSSVDDAIRDGYVGLCATGDMRWELGDDENFERLAEYEAKLEDVIRELPLRGICQYHRDLLPAAAIGDALLTHRSMFVGDHLHADNLFYVPPELLLEHGGATARAKHADWMYKQILRIVDAERRRDDALSVLRTSEAEQRRLAGQLADLNRDLERRVSDRTAELALSNRHLEAFSYSVAHDLREPLRTVRSFAGLLDEHAGTTLDDECRDHLRRIRAGAERMTERIDALLDLARITRAGIARDPVDLGEIARAIVDELREREPDRKVELVVAPSLHATADARMMRALLENLLRNAWKFTATRSSAHIEVGARDGSFFVRDDGVGFDPRRAERLFQPFQRLHGSEFAGTGIGLATVHRIVERHGGMIWADAAVGKGATFSFTLPER